MYKRQRQTLLALPFPSVLRFHRVLYVRVTITSLLKNTCLDVRTSAVFGEKLNPARPLEGSKFAAASSLQTAAEYEVSAQGGAALLGERAGTFNLKL